MELYYPRYVNSGPRAYADRPVPRYRRGVWELQLVRGTATPHFGLGDADRGLLLPPTGGPSENDGASEDDAPADGPLEDDAPAGQTGHAATGEHAAGRHARSLRLFRPACVHGWRDEPGARSEIAVIHLDGVPDEIDAVLADASWVRLSIPKGAQRMQRRFDYLRREIAELATPVSSGPAEHLAALRSTAVIITVAALLRENSGSGRDAAPRRSIADAAVAWYEANMHTACSVAEVAAGVAVSESTLRRVFRREMGESVGTVFMRRRMSRASWMLRNSAEPVSAVAEACGYRDQSAFARQVRRALGRSPRTIRDERR
jgi:AraC-like DNA-binding protein